MFGTKKSVLIALGSLVVLGLGVGLPIGLAFQQVQSEKDDHLRKYILNNEWQKYQGKNIYYFENYLYTCESRSPTATLIGIKNPKDIKTKSEYELPYELSNQDSFYYFHILDNSFFLDRENNSFIDFSQCTLKIPGTTKSLSINGKIISWYTNDEIKQALNNKPFFPSGLSEIDIENQELYTFIMNHKEVLFGSNTQTKIVGAVKKVKA